MKTLLTAALTFITVLTIARSSDFNDLIKQASNIEDRREKETALMRYFASEKNIDESQKHKFIVDLLDKQQGEVLLEVSRQLFASGYFKDNNSAVGELITLEKKITDMESLIKEIKTKNLEVRDLPLALIALQKTRDTWEARAVQEGLFIFCLELVNRRYPEMLDAESIFAKRVQGKIDAAVEGKDPICSNPRHVLIFALQARDEIMRKESKGAPSLAPIIRPIIPVPINSLPTK